MVWSPTFIHAMADDCPKHTFQFIYNTHLPFQNARVKTFHKCKRLTLPLTNCLFPLPPFSSGGASGAPKPTNIAVSWPCVPQPRRWSKVIDPNGWRSPPTFSLSHLAPPPPLFLSRSVFWMAGCYIGASSGGPQVPRGGRGTGGLNEQGGGGGLADAADETAGQGLCGELSSRNCPRPASCRCRGSRSNLGLASSWERRVSCEGEHVASLLHPAHLHGNLNPACCLGQRSARILHAISLCLKISISCSSHI